MSLVLANAQLRGRVADVLLVDGVVVAIGDDLAAGFSAALANAERVDLDGRFLVPGLWDEHVHLTQHALAQRRVDLASATSAAAAAHLMGAALDRAVPGIVFAGAGFRDGLWPDVPTAELLDSTVGDRPTVLMSGDLHSCWLNTAALAHYGFAGREDAILREDDAFLVQRALQDVPEDVLDTWVFEAARIAASRGVVGVVDLEMRENFGTWRRRMAGGFDALRIEAGIYPEFLDAAIADGLYTGMPLDGTGGLLRVGPFKVITDGSLNTRTAYCIDPYSGLSGPASHGLLTVPPEQLVPLMRKASAAGIVPAVHAIGDEANRLALDAFEQVGCHGRIEHAQLLLESDFPRFARLGVAASVQPEHAMDDRYVADRYWAGRTERAFTLRSLLDAGAELLLGSDAPVAPLDPWVSAAAAVGRSRDGLAPWHPEQAIGNAEALAASARGRSTISLGDVADLAVVDIDPVAATHEQLRAMPVSGTLLGGRFTYRAL